MTDRQWEILQTVVRGEASTPLPVGFIIDSPWLPGWAGMSTLHYYADRDAWFRANLQAIEAFPDVLFLPGFWAEYGMCTEPSAFGAKCTWFRDGLPHADPVATSPEAAANLPKPNVQTDGLLPFVLERLTTCADTMRKHGHAVRFAVARGPLNIASFLLGTTEFMLALHEHPEACDALLITISDFLEDWLRLQRERFSDIDGIFLLDDIVGFIGQQDLRRFALPHLARLFRAFPASVRFFHNDANGMVCAPFLADIGVNLFNFSFEHSLREMREACGPKVALLGNIPPRDVLAGQSADAIRTFTRNTVSELDDTRGILLSCGGGMPPHVATEQIQAFLEGARTS